MRTLPKQDCARCHEREGTEQAYITSRCCIETVLICKPCKRELQEARFRPVAYTKTWAADAYKGPDYLRALERVCNGRAS